MNKKVIGILVVIAIVLLLGIPQYESYQNTLLSEHFNETIQNASSIETEIINTVNGINTQNTTDADVLISTINNDITPKYSEELLRLNESGVSTSNETEHKYIDLQTKRIELESKNLNNTVTTLNALSQYVKGEKSAEDAQTAINNANTQSADINNELTKVYSDIKTLLEQNPDLNKKLHDLNLEKSYYGETNVQTQNITNSTSV
ncbi:hypothetical protein [Methanosphaera sp. WGK6]|uniref:hypothetical protein n=1 Tax=Methanosphaera sp. WGK6 TaxID=1561964 RepID=UPI00084BE89C|nr:hypothetical protein [Methanosphaera sp. WGK6]OED30858.1 hypothetical protein NL43_00670 [Methanosphaera sp. WGK6]